MESIYRQDRIISKIDKLNLLDFPHTLLLVGEKGSGKQFIVDYIINKYKSDIEDISDNISYDKIQNIIDYPLVKFYLIHREAINVKNENMLLKLLEEPINNCYIIIVAEKEDLIDTVKNRCMIWKLDEYDSQYLISLLNDDSDIRLVSLFHTPRQILKYKDINLNDLLNKISSIFDKIGNANLANILTISNWVDFDDNGKGFPIDLFISGLQFVIRQKILNSTSPIYLKYFDCTKDFISMVTSHVKVDKRRLFENYLLKLRY